MKAEDIWRGFQDHSQFCKHSLTVETEQRTLVPMVLSPGQVRLEEAIRKQRLAERPVRIIYLKSRRIQATTGTAARFFHDTAFHAGVHTIVLAHDAPSSEKIFKIYERFYQKYQPFGGIDDNAPGYAIKLPQARALSDRINFAYGGDAESSFIQVHTAGNINFGRSFRITNLHFSEFPYYPDAAAIRASAMSAVAKQPDTTVIIEGTAKAIGDDFHRIWQEAVDPSVESEWIPLFMGWWEFPDNRLPLNVRPDQFQDSLRSDERELRGRYNLTLEQLYWRRYTIKSDCGGDLDVFHREHPANPEEAFMASSRNRFSIPHIQRMPLRRDAMVGELHVETVGTEERTVFLQGDSGALRIYRMPEKGHLYACGADPSGGADANKGKGRPDADWAVAHIFDRDTAENCATLRLRAMPGEFGRYCNRLLRFYRMAQVAMERNGAGIGSLEALLNCNYPPGLMYHRPVAGDQDPQVRSDKLGWNTDEVSRQQLISLLDEAIRQSAIFVHDPTTIQELLWFVINERGRAEAQPGTHDDCVIALALTVLVMARMPKPILPDRQAAPKLMKYGQKDETDRRGRLVRLR